jgi:hypothetical protein
MFGSFAHFVAAPTSTPTTATPSPVNTNSNAGTQGEGNKCIVIHICVSWIIFIVCHFSFEGAKSPNGKYDTMVNRMKADADSIQSFEIPLDLGLRQCFIWRWIFLIIIILTTFLLTLSRSAMGHSPVRYACCWTTMGNASLSAAIVCLLLLFYSFFFFFFQRSRVANL